MVEKVGQRYASQEVVLAAFPSGYALGESVSGLKEYDEQ